MARTSRTAFASSRANRVLATIVLLPAVPALFVLNYLTFIPIYARDILGDRAGGPRAAHRARSGSGPLVGALSLAALRPSGGSGRLVLGGLGIVGVALTTFAVSRSLPLSMLALALIGTFQVSFYSTTNTLIQVLVPARLRGRVLSLYLLTSIGLIPIAQPRRRARSPSTLGVEVVLAAGGVHHGRGRRPRRLRSSRGRAAPGRAPVRLGRGGLTAAAALGRRDPRETFSAGPPQG